MHARAESEDIYSSSVSEFAILRFFFLSCSEVSSEPFALSRASQSATTPGHHHRTASSDVELGVRSSADNYLSSVRPGPSVLKLFYIPRQVLAMDGPEPQHDSDVGNCWGDNDGRGWIAHSHLVRSMQ